MAKYQIIIALRNIFFHCVKREEERFSVTITYSLSSLVRFPRIMSKSTNCFAIVIAKDHKRIISAITYLVKISSVKIVLRCPKNDVDSFGLIQLLLEEIKLILPETLFNANY